MLSDNKILELFKEFCEWFLDVALPCKENERRSEYEGSKVGLCTMLCNFVKLKVNSGVVKKGVEADIMNVHLYSLLKKCTFGYFRFKGMPSEVSNRATKNGAFWFTHFWFTHEERIDFCNWVINLSEPL